MKRKLCILTLIFILLFTGLAQGQGLNFDVNAGMREALKVISADIFRKQYGVSGNGIKIAVIDTGIDVSHPDLRETSQGKVKVIDYIDFTDEGFVNTKTEAIPDNNTVVLEGQKYNVEDIRTRCGSFHLGVFEEKQIAKDSPIGQDANRNGKNDDIFGVLVTDSVLPGIYDTVYVDTNQNFDFSDETPLKVYSRDFQWAAFGRDNPATDYVEESSFVVTSIDVKGNFVKLSFDGNGHGTHVAGIIGANGELLGMAPDAQMIAIKALGSAGDGNWEDIFKAIDYAGKQGADIINVSIGDLVSSKEGHAAQLRILKKMSLESNAMLVMAAGNSGPGLGTAYDTGGGDNIITVGAYMSPGLWNTNYNVTIPDETLWYYSGVGNGSSKPTVVAPSSVISTVNRWDSAGYFLMDGTSMAVPFVSGSLALLMQKAKIEGLPISPISLKKSIEIGARKINGYVDIEQGSGLINIVKSWDILKDTGAELQDTPNIVVNLPESPGYTEGVFYRDRLKGQQKLVLTNMSNTLQTVKLESGKEWVKIDENNNEVILPRGKPQSIMLSYNIPEQPGLHIARIVGTDIESGKPVMDFSTTAVVPYDLRKTGNVSINGSLSPSQWQRFFFKTVPGMADINITLKVVEKDKPLGRALMYIYGPDGQRVYEDVAGADYISTSKSITFKKPKPEPGIWEVVVAADYNLSDFGTDVTVFQMTAEALGIFTDVEELAFSAQEGEGYISREIMLKNGGGTFYGRLEGMGMAEKNEGISSTNIMVKNGEFAKGPVINIPENAMSLSIDLIPKNNCEGDVDLYLYKKNKDTGLYEEAAFSTKIDVLEERIYLTRPESGEYAVYVDGFSVPEGVAAFEVKTQVMRDHMDAYIQDIAGERKPGQHWKSRLDINIPTIGSEFVGYIAVKNDKGNEISQIPLKLVIGKKQLTVEILPDGIVTVREKETRNPVTTNILINGIEYPVISGKAIIPGTLTIERIEIYDDR
ncbi:MAG: S8 family serine peptidase, partial [Tepidanaerobacteraceae bacterium]|nr:S8 family serine peptidase [Tepidanaerobacteraceae bacterium]